MQPSRFRTILPFAALAAMFALASPASAQITYTVTHLGPLPGGAWTTAYDLNDAGHVVGITGDNKSYIHAVLWTETGIQDLGTLGDVESYAYGINNNDQVVGWSYNTFGNERPFLWDSAHGMIDLGTLGGRYGYAYGINNLGQIVGEASGNAFLYDDTMHNLGSLGGGSTANHINDMGQIVGKFWTHRAWHGFLYDAGALHDLGVLASLGISPDSDSEAWSLNEGGDIVGQSTGTSGTHAVLWYRGIIEDLGALGDGESTARDINDMGQIVGASLVDGGYHATLWQDGSIYDLNDLVSPRSDWSLFFASAINDGGQIVGLGSKGAYLLTPRAVPEPGALAMLVGIGVAGAGLLNRRRT